MSHKIEVTFPNRPIIVTLGDDHSTVVYRSQVINKRSIRALGCIIHDSPSFQPKPGDQVAVFGYNFMFEHNATYIGTDYYNDHCAIVQDSDGETESYHINRIKPVQL